jgi:hypothetical protein
MHPADNSAHLQHPTTRGRYFLGIALLSLLLAAARPLATQEPKVSGGQQSSSDNDSIGFNLGKNASAKDVGLPIYPGARRHKDDSNDSSALNMDLWGGSTGFKLFVLKLETTDAPETVAAFYRKALAKYGTVLDCSNASAAQGEKPKRGEISLKAGTKEKEHLVGIEPNGSGTIFQLVYIETNGTD